MASGFGNTEVNRSTFSICEIEDMRMMEKREPVRKRF
jgi:hypothetical protein